MRMTLLALLLAACATTKKEEGASKLTAADYAPYALGASWTFAVNYLGQQAEQTITVVKEEEGYFVDDQQARFRITDEGLRDPSRFLIRHPIEEGREWKAILSASSVEHYRILTVGEPCEARAGRFQDCLVIESKNRLDEKMTLVARWTWARGVGLVRLQTESDIKGKRQLQTERSLIHYSLSPKPAEDEAPTTWSK